jgi:hypothetical protein
MTEDRLPLVELLQQAGDGNSLCSAAVVLQLLMEADVEGRRTVSPVQGCQA